MYLNLQEKIYFALFKKKNRSCQKCTRKCWNYTPAKTKHMFPVIPVYNKTIPAATNFTILKTMSQQISKSSSKYCAEGGVWTILTEGENNFDSVYNFGIWVQYRLLNNFEQQ